MKSKNLNLNGISFISVFHFSIHPDLKIPCLDVFLLGFYAFPVIMALADFDEEDIRSDEKICKLRRCGTELKKLKKNITCAGF